MFDPIFRHLSADTPLGAALAKLGYDPSGAAAALEDTHGVIVVPPVPQELLCRVVRRPEGAHYACLLCTYRSKTRSNVNTHTKVRERCVCGHVVSRVRGHVDDWGGD